MTKSDIRQINSEEVIFYVDLSKGEIKKDTLIKAIRLFIEEKNNYTQKSTYGVVLFQENDNPISEYDKGGFKTITNIIEEKWETRPKDQTFIENGLFEILSYIFRASREHDKIYRIIIISDTPSERSEDYHNAVYDLILKSKKFRTFIDIIRIGNDAFYPDEMKLKIITSETNGGVFYCNPAQFLDMLISLVKHKEEFNLIKGEKEGSEILEEDKIFYEKLAVDLISLSSEDEEICTICDQELCPICGTYSDEVHKCFNCSAKFHSCCAAEYSLTNNIGFMHIFRCPQCDTLLKLDEDYVELILQEKLETEEGEVSDYESEQEEEIPIIEEMGVELEMEIPGGPSKKINEEEAIHILSSEDKIQIEIEPSSEESLKDVVKVPQPPPKPPKPPKIPIKGFFGPKIQLNAKTNKNKNSIKTNSSLSSEKENTLSITKLRPPRKKSKMKFCMICGATVQNCLNCPNCGAKID
ncbi:MAG: hypothetical protein GF383_13830 [Candidatus Lokiarchaeota archaeon]|nr:hypothetical protein [Candidatus Lokiarchaeota archaeon]MBD3342345.1 hypothetical protein [Candidatus Lokiarchaeota archaeon]